MAIPLIWDGMSNPGQGRILVKRGDKWGMIDHKGNLVINPQWDEIGYTFFEGLTSVRRGDGANEERGIMDLNGQIVVTPSWDKTHPFNEGLAAAAQGDKWGFINRDGSVVVPPTWDDAKGFCEGLSAVRKGDYLSGTRPKWGFIDREGKLVVPPIWDEVRNFSWGLATVKLRLKRKWGVIDREGNVIVSPTWDRIDIDQDRILAFESVGLREEPSGSSAARLCVMDVTGKVIWSSDGNGVGEISSVKSSSSVIPRTGRDPDIGAATRTNPYINSLGMKFVPVPIAGGPNRDQEVLFSIWETRLRDYASFYEQNPGIDHLHWKDVERAGHRQGAEHPVVNVSRLDAKDFCEWLTETERNMGRIGPRDEYRLPTDFEWSCAAGTGSQENPMASPMERELVGRSKAFPDMPSLPDNASLSELIAHLERTTKLEDVEGIDLYPWGRVWPPPRGGGNYSGEESLSDNKIDDYRDGHAFTAPVGSYTPNFLGIFDLGGNVWEWCDDWVDPLELQLEVQRGGSWRSWHPSESGFSCRRSMFQDADASGFRVVLSLDRHE
jgi:hypothetical protein